LCHFDISALDPYSFSSYQRIRNLAPRRRQHPLESGTRYVHLLGALFLFQALDIFQAYSLDLVYCNYDFIQLPQRDTCRFEIDYAGYLGYAAAFHRSGHITSFQSWL